MNVPDEGGAVGAGPGSPRIPRASPPQHLPFTGRTPQRPRPEERVGGSVYIPPPPCVLTHRCPGSWGFPATGLSPPLSVLSSWSLAPLWSSLSLAWVVGGVLSELADPRPAATLSCGAPPPVPTPASSTTALSVIGAVCCVHVPARDPAPLCSVPCFCVQGMTSYLRICVSLNLDLRVWGPSGGCCPGSLLQAQGWVPEGRWGGRFCPHVRSWGLCCAHAVSQPDCPHTSCFVLTHWDWDSPAGRGGEGEGERAHWSPLRSQL